MFIYKITNKITDKSYIGQTTNSILNRWKGHLLPTSNCIALKRAIIKYGKENFTIEEIDGANAQDELNYKEWLWIYKLNTLTPNGYNLKEGGAHGKSSLQTRMKQSNSMKGKNKNKTPEQLLRLSLINIGRVQSKDAISRRVLKTLKPIVDCSTGIIYKSTKEASNLLKLKTSGITKVLKLRSIHCGGRVFKYLSDYDNIIIPKIKWTNIKPKRIIDTTTGEIFYSSIEASLSLNIPVHIIKNSAIGRIAKKNPVTHFKYLD